MGKYTSRQKLSKAWVWVLFIISIGNFFIMLTILETHLVTGIIGMAIPFLVLILLLTLKLEVAVDEEKITYKLFPFHWHEKRIYRKDIEKLEVRNYNALSEYGGWGLRYSSEHGKAYILNGDLGLQLYLKNGKKILLGITGSDGLENSIKQMQ